MKARRQWMILTNSHPSLKPNAALIRRALLRAGFLKKERTVHFTFVDDKKISGLAGKYRMSPHPTDVLAFAYGNGNIAGDVVVSLDTARRQSAERGVPFHSEIILLCLHGLLHVMGLRDENSEDWREMRVKEFETMMRIIG